MGAHLALKLRQWKALLAIYVQEGIAYPATGLIWILTDLTTTGIMPQVWASAASSGSIAGFSTQDFVLYYLCLLVVSSLVSSHFMWEISFEIREGILSTHLLRPISYFQLIFMRNLAWRIVRTTIALPVFGLVFWLYSSQLSGAQLVMGWEFWVSLVLGHLVSVTFVVAMGCIALYTQEAQSIFDLYYIPYLFLSGSLFPIAMFPEWAQKLAWFFPFYFTVGAPTEILIGRKSGDETLMILAIQVAWIAASYLAYRVLWQKGLKQYTAVGM